MIKKVKFFKVIFLTVIFSVIVFSSFCKQKSSEGTFKGIDEAAALEIDVQKIKDSTGMSFEIAKTKNVGYEPLNKFYWVNVEEKLAEENLKILAQEIIDASIENKPKTYHSFTIHFLCRDKSKETREKPEAFAKVTYLPEGSWTKVGRLPINDYTGYELTCIIKDNMLE
jgi:hypothetical protein